MKVSRVNDASGFPTRVCVMVRHLKHCTEGMCLASTHQILRTQNVIPSGGLEVIVRVGREIVFNTLLFEGDGTCTG